MSTIRELFHSVGNSHNLITVGAGVTKELTRDCLKAKGLSPDLKEEIFEIEKNLDIIIKNAQKADKELREIHDQVYKVIDPDTGKPK